MIKTLNKNYEKNIKILKENIKRGMTYKMVINAITSQENQFINASLYNQMEKDYINELRELAINSFTPLKINLNK